MSNFNQSDFVRFTYRQRIGNINYDIILFGVFDGEKTEFHDKKKTVVRGTKWIEHTKPKDKQEEKKW